MNPLLFQLPNWTDEMLMLVFGLFMVAVEVLAVIISVFLIVIIAETLWAAVVGYTRYLAGRGLLSLSWNV